MVGEEQTSGSPGRSGWCRPSPCWGGGCWAGGGGVPPSLSPRPLDGSGTAQGFLRWAVANERRGLCFEPSLPGAGGPPLGPRPQQEESQPDWMSACPHTPNLGRVASLNLSFLHCKRGMKVPNLPGMCDFGRLTGESDPVCSRSYSEDGPRLMLGEDRQSRLPLRHAWGCVASALWPHPLFMISHPYPFPIPETIRTVRPQSHCIGKETRGSERVCDLLQVTPPGWQGSVNPRLRRFLMHSQCGYPRPWRMLRKFSTEGLPWGSKFCCPSALLYRPDFFPTPIFFLVNGFILQLSGNLRNSY